MGSKFTESTIRIPSATPGWELEAWQFVPTDVPSSQLPVVIMAHGIGLPRSSSLRAPGEGFASEGYGVVVFDFRSFGGSDGTPRNVLKIRDQQEDYKSVITYARQCGLFNPKKVVLWGTSFSGGHVMCVASEDHEVAGVIAQTPFSDGLTTVFGLSKIDILRATPFALYDLIRSFLPWYQPTYIKDGALPGSVAYLTAPGFYEGVTRISTNAPEFANEMQASELLAIPLYRPVNVAHNIKCPLLVTVAKDDNVTPASASLSAANRAPLGESVQFEGTHFDVYEGGVNYEAGLRAQVGFLHRVFREPLGAQ